MGLSRRLCAVGKTELSCKDPGTPPRPTKGISVRVKTLVNPARGGQSCGVDLARKSWTKGRSSGNRCAGFYAINLGDEYMDYSLKTAFTLADSPNHADFEALRREWFAVEMA